MTVPLNTDISAFLVLKNKTFQLVGKLTLINLTFDKLTSFKSKNLCLYILVAFISKLSLMM